MGPLLGPIIGKWKQTNTYYPTTLARYIFH